MITAPHLPTRAHLGEPGGGTVPADKVIGRAFVVVWPFTRVASVPIPETFAQPLQAAAATTGAVPVVIGSGSRRSCNHRPPNTRPAMAVRDLTSRDLTPSGLTPSGPTPSGPTPSGPTPSGGTLRYDVERTCPGRALDAEGRLLLFRTVEPGRPELGTWWELPGGGVEPGELGGRGRT